MAALEVASTRRERRRGLLGRERVEGALYLPGVRSIHTVGMRVPIDVAFVRRIDQPAASKAAHRSVRCAGGSEFVDVIAVRRMPAWRVGRPLLKSTGVVEAADGAFERWGLRVGDRLEVCTQT